MKFLLNPSNFKWYSNFYSFNRRMPSIYHEHCGKPGPKSNDYVPPPEARFFKSRSAPNSPLLGERKPLFPPRASPRTPRVLNQVSNKLAAAAKSSKPGKVGRSRSFNSKGMSLFCNFTGIAIFSPHVSYMASLKL